MRAYECTIAYHPDLGADGVKEQIERTKQVITGSGGSEIQVHEWGMRELAYPIQKQKRAQFFVVEFHGGGEAVAELERNLRIADPCLRYLTISVDPNRPPLELSGVRRETEEAPAPAGEEAIPAAEAAADAEAATEAPSEPQA
jgi:small subunit ribosomal protein S6